MNKIKKVVQKTKKLMFEQEQKINLDKVQVEINVDDDPDIRDNYEFEQQFDKSFYGRHNVDKLKNERFHMRNKVVEYLGKEQACKGISEKNPIFFISKKKPFSKQFIK